MIARRRRFLLVGLVLAMAIAGLSGCGRFTDTIGVAAEGETYELYGTRTVQQRFVAHHAGLVAIGVLLQARPGSGPLTLHLRADAEGMDDLATVTVALPASEMPVYHTLTLPVQDDVNGQPFLLLLEAPEATAETAVLLPYSVGAPGEQDLWLDGTLSSGGHLALQLGYDPVLIVKDLARQATTFGLRSLWLLFLSALFYLLPGGALVVWLLRDGDWIERVVVALGMSVAVYALLVYATMTGLRLGQAATYGFLAVCAGLIALRWWLDGRPVPAVRRAWAGLRADPAPLALAVVVVLVVAVRVWVTRDMVAPRWGDSYHHTVISQLLVDNGGLFDSWAPYAPYRGLTTHFGFHANVALFHWLSGESVIQSVIWIGQMMNALAVLALYPLGKRIGGPWAGTVAVMVAGLFSTTPMAYMNWGRYPQLTGQVVLPVAAWLLWVWADVRRFSPRLLVLNAFGALGQALSYYRIPYYFVILAGAWVLCVAAQRLGLEWRKWGAFVLKVAALGLVSALVLLPWGLHLMRAHIGTTLTESVSEGGQAGDLMAELRQYQLLGLYVPLPLVVLAGGAIVYAAVTRDRLGLLASVWAIGLVGANAARMLGIPGAMYLTAFASMIFLYAPVSLLIGWFAARGLSFLRTRHSFVRLASIPTLTAISLLGFALTAGVSSSAYNLVEPADLRAMAWIRANVPREARFLVNGFTIYDGSTIVGSDAGWWIPLLTERVSTMPPQYALLTEEEVEPGYGQRMVGLVSALRHHSVSSPEGLALLCSEGITHVYIGQGEGRVAVPPSEPLFTAGEMLASPAFQELYHRDKVWILALNRSVCAGHSG